MRAVERSKAKKGKEEENRKRQRLSSFLLTEPGSLEINLLELITTQTQLTEAPVHSQATWHLPGAEHGLGGELVLPSPSHTGSAQHSEHPGSFWKTSVTTLVSSRHAQSVRPGNCKYWDFKGYKQQRKKLSSIKAHILKSHLCFNTALCPS